MLETFSSQEVADEKKIVVKIFSHTGSSLERVGAEAQFCVLQHSRPLDMVTNAVPPIPSPSPNAYVSSSSDDENDIPPFVQKQQQRPPTLSLASNAHFSSPSREAPHPTPPLRPRTAIQESSSHGVLYGEAKRRGKRRVHCEDRSVFMPFVARSAGMMRKDSEDGTETDCPLSLFAVFDGHGGQRASEFASTRLPQILLNMCAKSKECVDGALRDAFLKTDEEFLSGRQRDGKQPLSRQGSRRGSGARTSVGHAASEDRPEDGLHSLQKTKSGSRFMSVALQRGGSFTSIGSASEGRFEMTRSASLHRYDLSSDGSSIMGSSRSSLQGSPPSKLAGLPPTGSPIPFKMTVPPALTRSKSKAEDQISELFATSNPTCGTTATVVLLFGDELNIAYVGDSRAVVSICGEAVRMGEDHRPTREDEGTRIENAGGLILYVGGTERVNGVLAVSRAIGDQGLKEFVVAEPELFWRKLIGEEELFIVASDGLWDFVGDQESVDLAKGIMSQEDNMGNMMEDAARELVRLACERGSTDDVSVVVVDMGEYWKTLETCAVSEADAESGVEKEFDAFEITPDRCRDGANSDTRDSFMRLQERKAFPQFNRKETVIEDSNYEQQLDPTPTPRHKVRKETGW